MSKGTSERWVRTSSMEDGSSKGSFPSGARPPEEHVEQGRVRDAVGAQQRGRQPDHLAEDGRPLEEHVDHHPGADRTARAKSSDQRLVGEVQAAGVEEPLEPTPSVPRRGGEPTNGNVGVGRPVDHLAVAAAARRRPRRRRPACPRRSGSTGCLSASPFLSSVHERALGGHPLGPQLVVADDPFGARRGRRRGRRTAQGELLAKQPAPPRRRCRPSETLPDRTSETTTSGQDSPPSWSHPASRIFWIRSSRERCSTPQARPG